MKEADWRKAKKGEEMLALVAPHLSKRQWDLLACMFVRRLGKLLSEPRLSDAVSWIERHAGSLPKAGALALRDSLPEAIEAAVLRARSEQQAIVAAAGPEADPDSFQHVEGRKTNASAPLFQAAADRAQRAIFSAGEAASRAGAAVVERLLPGVSCADELLTLRRLVVQAIQEQASGSLNVALALKFNNLGDESADRDNGRDVSKRYASALSTVEREEEYAGYRESDVLQQKHRADEKALGPILQELCGNVCRPAVLDPAWRTADVIALAQSMETERTPDRMLILRDALLDAGCDNRAILRHCRGMKEDKDEPVAHAAGCWVIDTILERESAFRARLPLGTASSPSRRKKT